ncbi:hypothetical protein GF319_01315 [Candidatus Bathyarchaeota archaeon]|nr:hypothetical protein [Candidatus Bathyarchaeota archaeon]
MTCPWLLEKNGGFECSAVSPPVNLDFSEETPPDLNGDICKLPEPRIPTKPPWEQCNRFKPVSAETNSELVEEVRNIDRRVLYASLFIIITLGILMNFTQAQIYSNVALHLIVIILLANIAYLYSKYSG